MTLTLTLTPNLNTIALHRSKPNSHHNRTPTQTLAEPQLKPSPNLYPNTSLTPDRALTPIQNQPPTPTRWEQPDEPDTKGLQLATLKRYLVDHPKVSFAWF